MPGGSAGAETRSDGKRGVIFEFEQNVVSERPSESGELVEVWTDERVRRLFQDLAFGPSVFGAEECAEAAFDFWNGLAVDGSDFAAERGSGIICAEICNTKMVADELRLEGI